MMPWPKRPVIYEINTWVWLQELSRAEGRTVTLSNVPAGQWDALAGLCLDVVWFMGVWERSPEGARIALADDALVATFRRALTDFVPEDNVGSPYCVRCYSADVRLGGPEGLAVARQELAQRGIRLILDYVPNHVASDHAWAQEHPEYFIHGTPEDLQQNGGACIEIGGHVLACGRDPNFPAWTDVLQLNAFHPGLRQAAAETVAGIAAQCDGVRCDMAMLMMNPIFERTWGGRGGSRPALEYWAELIAQVKALHPGFLFIAEAYWDLEWELQQQGFDYCYDKRLYDRLRYEGAEGVRQHLRAGLAYQEKLVRFIENHDESRAAAAFSPRQERAAAVVAATLPGAKLLHEGQLEGRRVRVPVQLGRRPVEVSAGDLPAFYRQLLGALCDPALRDGEWQLCECSGWPDNQSYLNLLAWSWRTDEDRCLIVVNLSSAPAQGRVRVGWPDLSGRVWCLEDVLGGAVYERKGNEMLHPGLYVGLEEWGVHFFKVTSSSPAGRRLPDA